MKRVTIVNGWCLLFAGAFVALGACVEEGPDAPPLRGVPGPTQQPAGGGAGMAGMAGMAGSMGVGGTNQGGQGGGGAGGMTEPPDAGADAADADAG